MSCCRIHFAIRSRCCSHLFLHTYALGKGSRQDRGPQSVVSWDVTSLAHLDDGQP